MGGGSMGGGGGGGGGGGRGSGKVRDGSTGPLSRQGVKDLCGAMGAAVDRLVASLRPLVVPDATLRAGIKVDLVDAAMPALEAFDVRHAAVTSTFKHRAKHVKYTAPKVDSKGSLCQSQLSTCAFLCEYRLSTCALSCETCCNGLG